MKRYRNTNDFTRNQIQLGTTSRNPSAATWGNGRNQPPRKSVTTTDETTIMLAYSARKNSANRIPLYSVWKPPVSSCSASGRSKGARLVSARPPISTSTNATGCTKMNQRRWLYCAFTMPTMLSVRHQDDAHQRQRHSHLVADELR